MTEKQTILLVDDSRTILSILKEMLQGNNFHLLTASSGKEALTAAEKHPPDLILLDIEMPEMDGLQTCRKLKAHDNEQLANIPVLFLSSFEDVANKIKGFEAGGLDYINKPVRREELIARVKIHLELKHLQEQLYRRIEERERLIHILCHDISNPLSSIMGWADMLSNDMIVSENPPLEKGLQRILHSAQQTSDIIDHVRAMEIQRTKHNNKLKLEPVSLKGVVHSALVVFENQLKEKNITFECVPPLDKLETKIIAEKTSFTANVFSNLFSNAIKFSYPGSVITLRVEEDGDVRLVLGDQGIGIPGNLMENIFNPVKSMSRIGTSGEKGNGFGMPLVKKYMDKYGGKILIDSKPLEKFPQQHGTEIQLILKNGKKNEKISTNS